MSIASMIHANCVGIAHKQALETLVSEGAILLKVAEDQNEQLSELVELQEKEIELLKKQREGMRKVMDALAKSVFKSDLYDSNQNVRDAVDGALKIARKLGK